MPPKMAVCFIKQMRWEALAYNSFTSLSGVVHFITYNYFMRTAYGLCTELHRTSAHAYREPCQSACSLKNSKSTSDQTLSIYNTVIV